MSAPTVVSLVWGEPGEQLLAQGDVVRSLGYEHSFMDFSDDVPPEAGILLIQGPYGSVRPLAKRLLQDPSRRRQLVVVYWFQQNLAVGLPPIIDRFAPAVIHGIASRPARGGVSGMWRRLIPARLRHPGGRVENLGSLRWLHRHGLVDVQACSSTVFRDRLAREGIEAIVVPRGYHPRYGERRRVERDIAAVWLGKMRSRRRRRIVYGLRDRLSELGLEMRIHDGEDRPFIYGEARTALLNRAKIVVNVHVRPTDEISIRHYVAMANGAVVLSEPNCNSYPFRAGTHYLESEPGRFADVILDIESYPRRREEIAARAEALITEELSLTNSVATLLEAAMRAAA